MPDCGRRELARTGGWQVSPMTGGAPACPFAFQDRRLTVLWDHWASSLRPDHMPRREDIEAGALREILDITWIYRLDDSGRDFYCALAGDLIMKAWQRPNMIGAPITLLFAPDIYQMLRTRWLELLERPAVMHGSMRYNPTGFETSASQPAERLSLPLYGADGRPYGMIGATGYVRAQRSERQEPETMRLLPPKIVPVADLFLTAPPRPATT